MFEPGHEKMGGRQKGSVNKTTRTVKEVVLMVFNELQEDENHDLMSFAIKNPVEFYKIAAKLIPTEVKGSVETKLITIVPPNKK